MLNAVVGFDSGIWPPFFTGTGYKHVRDEKPVKVKTLGSSGLVLYLLPTTVPGK